MFANEDGKMKCVQFQTQERTWEAARDGCVGLGGSLLAINSPKDQDISSLFPLYPGAIGRYIYITFLQASIFMNHC